MTQTRFILVKIPVLDALDGLASLAKVHRTGSLVRNEIAEGEREMK